MAFLPGLTTERSVQNVKRTSKRSEASEADTKSGYRVSLADINSTPRQGSCNSVFRCPNGRNTTGKRDTVSTSDWLIVLETCLWTTQICLWFVVHTGIPTDSYSIPGKLPMHESRFKKGLSTAAHSLFIKSHDIYAKIV